ncbi:MAG: hypothetical protein LPH21_12855 [Shewanella sp.]|nr:hypothetical protein [Shewanella sp.]
MSPIPGLSQRIEQREQALRRPQFAEAIRRERVWFEIGLVNRICRRPGGFDKKVQWDPLTCQRLCGRFTEASLFARVN